MRYFWLFVYLREPRTIVTPRTIYFQSSSRNIVTNATILLFIQVSLNEIDLVHSPLRIKCCKFRPFSKFNQAAGVTSKRTRFALELARTCHGARFKVARVMGTTQRSHGTSIVDVQKYFGAEYFWSLWHISQDLRHNSRTVDSIFYVQRYLKRSS
jgi:hypothetical protein